jgi:bisphosphoglycerate-dependent phosphoglycerate mutase
MKPNESDRETIYHIRLKESLNQNFTDWLGDQILTRLEDGKTLLVGPFVDQSALRGLLNQLWNLNITVISVDKIENEN